MGGHIHSQSKISKAKLMEKVRGLVELYSWINGDKSIDINALLKRNPSIVNAKRADDGVSPLYEAVSCQNMPAVKLLLEHGANTELTSEHERFTPLHRAASIGYYPALVELVEHGADVNAKTEVLHMTPIHLAAANGYQDMTKFLIDNGAAIDSQDDHDYTPLHRLAESIANCAGAQTKGWAIGNEEQIQQQRCGAAILLMGHGANQSLVNNEGLTWRQKMTSVPNLLKYIDDMFNKPLLDRKDGQDKDDRGIDVEVDLG